MPKERPETKIWNRNYAFGIKPVPKKLLIDFLLRRIIFRQNNLLINLLNACNRENQRNVKFSKVSFFQFIGYCYILNKIDLKKMNLKKNKHFVNFE